MSPDDRLKRMTKEFNLTADQQSKIKPILVDEQKKMEDLRNDSSGDRQAMRGKMMQIRQDTNDQVRALLDDKQKEKFDKQEQERQDRMQNRRGGGPGGPGGDNSGRQSATAAELAGGLQASTGSSACGVFRACQANLRTPQTEVCATEALKIRRAWRDFPPGSFCALPRLAPTWEGNSVLGRRRFERTA